MGFKNLSNLIDNLKKELNFDTHAMEIYASIHKKNLS